jgi:hypothetical protein
MATYTVNNSPGRVGVDPVTSGVAVASSDSFVNDGKTYVHVYNGNAGTLTITIPFASTVNLDGVDPADPTVTINTTKGKTIGPLQQQLYNDATGKATFNYSVTASVTAYAFKYGS